jgi:hypothetical protein
MRKDEDVFLLRLAAERARPLDQDGSDLGSLGQPLLGDGERRSRIDPEQGHAVVMSGMAASLTGGCFLGGGRCAGAQAQNLLGPLVPALAADEEPHDTHFLCSLLFQGSDLFLDGACISHSEGDSHGIGSLQVLDGVEHGLVPFLGAAVGHDEQAERFLTGGLCAERSGS